MDAIVAVCDLYRSELDDCVATLRNRGLLISERSSQVRRLRSRNSRASRVSEQESLSFGESTREISHINTSHRATIEVFLWGAILVFFSHIGSSFGSHVASPLLNVIFDKQGASVFAYMLLPILTNIILRKHKRRGMSDSKTRFMLLTAALMQGITSGYVIDSTYISGEPLGFVTPLAIVMAYLGEVASVYKNRGALFVACATSALIANLGIGMLLNAITKTYELMTFAYVAAGLMTMKLVLKNVHRPGTGHSQQFFLLQSFTLIRALTFLICGYYKGEHVYARLW
ncbi:hypothetical protein Y032_0080g1352 [Ancylostoma ceylanicum]|uniref:Uncharacterized protein n=1 Tax=Ancylostoma ceylanicum TaxID=53326 RepID=A0A016TSZ7_9BILA|nr:hypothetical protein Y032_0080g1352 [Ancylostoma ceylanicum]